jgi:hypothetical protein
LAISLFEFILTTTLGQEHKGKGVTVQLGPVAGPLGRAPEGGRNWEGFSPDPVLTGIGMAETVRGIQDAGVIACAKHFIGNEQVNILPMLFPPQIHRTHVANYSKGTFPSIWRSPRLRLQHHRIWFIQHR